MKTQASVPESGIQIENTLSMGLRRKADTRDATYGEWLSAAGIFTCILTFLSMFEPECMRSIVYLSAVLSSFFFSAHAKHPRSRHLSMLPVLGAYGAVIWFLREKIICGLMLLMNRMYQSIYLTDWTYFDIEMPDDAALCITLFLCVGLFPLAGLLSYALVRFRNFFLSFLVTFPLVELGLFFGLVPGHWCAAALLAFWCAAAAWQFSGAGGMDTSREGAGFLRRHNSFYPAPGMRFLLSDLSSVCIFGLVLLLCIGIDLALTAAEYERPDTVREMRTYYMQYASTIDWTDKDSVFTFLQGRSGDLPEPEEITLGNEDAQEFEDVPVTSIAFSEIPQGRVYLRLRAAHTYNGRSWTGLPEEAMSDPVFGIFDAIGYHPPEFLYYTDTESRHIRMSMYHSTDTLGMCVPYGFKQTSDVLCKRDDSLSTRTTVYTFCGGTDYENTLSVPGALEHDRTVDLLPCVSPENAAVMAQLVEAHPDSRVWVQAQSRLLSHYYGGTGNSSKAAEAAILCGCGYTDAVFANETPLPDSPALDAVRQEYADLFAGFNARTASPARTIGLLQALRERVCREVTYDLAPGRTPADQDFTAFFLLENRRGYCQHYACAGTVLARMAGIPARYCEGYMVDCSRPDATQCVETPEGMVYTAEILDSNAHAWTEIYLDGIGWIPFEFTYSYFTPPEASQPPPAVPVSPPTQNTVIPTQPPTQSTSTEAATVQPDAPAVPDAPDVQGTRTTGRLIRILAVCALLVAAALLLVMRHNALCRRDAALSSQSDHREAARYLCARIGQMAALCGVPPEAASLAHLEEEWCSRCAPLLPDEDLLFTVRLTAELRYSPHDIAPEDLERLRDIRERFAQALYRSGSIRRRLYLRWILHLLP